MVATKEYGKRNFRSQMIFQIEQRNGSLTTQMMILHGV